MHVHKIFGPPGTGKTTRLLEIMEQEMERGVAPDQVAFVTFTRKGATEARERAMQKFKLTEKQLPYFRTLHSLGFAGLSISRENVMGNDYNTWKEFGDAAGFAFQKGFSMQNGIVMNKEVALGDKMRFLYDYSRNTRRPLADVHRMLQCDFPLHQAQYFIDSVEEYKQAKGMFDFTDMLQMWEDELPVRVAIIDEAQDLTALQWEMVNKAFAGCERVYLAGDDDQAIYNWAGADSFLFQQRTCTTQEVLDHSYRLPAAIWDRADDISSRIQVRQPKQWQPRGEGGEIRNYSEVEDILPDDEQTWMFLARNQYQLRSIRKHLRHLGYVYEDGTKPEEDGKRMSVPKKQGRAVLSWTRLVNGEAVSIAEVRNVLRHMRQTDDLKTLVKRLERYDKRPVLTHAQLVEEFSLNPEKVPWYVAFAGGRITERDIAYFRAALRRGHNILRKPNILISTIHGVKGGEADNVVVLREISRQTWNGMRFHNADDEHRVAYVAVTRAKQALHFVREHSPYAYDYH